MYTCRDCNQSFSTTLALELHRDDCTKGQLLCQVCGERFREREGTQDGWHYECPNDDCDGAGLGEDLFDLTEVRVPTQ